MKFNQVIFVFLLLAGVKLQAHDSKDEAQNIWDQHIGARQDKLIVEAMVGLASIIEFVRVNDFGDGDRALQTLTQARCQYGAFCHVGGVLSEHKAKIHDEDLKREFCALEAYVGQVTKNNNPYNQCPQNNISSEVAAGMERQYAALLTALHDKCARIAASHERGEASVGDRCADVMQNLKNAKHSQTMKKFEVTLGKALQDSFPGFSDNLVEIEGINKKSQLYADMKAELNSEIELLLNQFECSDAGRSMGSERAAEYRFVLNITNEPKLVFYFSGEQKHVLQGFVTAKVIHSGISESVNSEVDVFKYYIGEGFKKNKNKNKHLFDFISKVIFDQTAWRKMRIHNRANADENQDRLFTQAASLQREVKPSASAQESWATAEPQLFLVPQASDVQKLHPEELQEDAYFTFLPGKGPSPAKKGGAK